MRSEWVEPLLTEHLGRVRAPEELWYRVRKPQLNQHRSSRPQLAWALATTLAIVSVAWGFHTRLNTLASHDAGLTFRCADPGQLRAWVKANTGLDIPLPAKLAASVELVSARLIKTDRPTAQLDYRVAGGEARLLVARAGATTSPHRLPAATDRQASWTMRGQAYTLACVDPATLRAACLLCHVGGQSL
jgi:hypothetical protein